MSGSEDQFLRAVVDLAHMYGWLAAHHDKSARKVGERWISNLTGDKGSPDLLLARVPRVILPELKTGTKYGKIRAGGGQHSYGLTPDQRQWRDVLKECPGAEWYLWTPDMMDEIARILAR